MDKTFGVKVKIFKSFGVTRTNSLLIPETGPAYVTPAFELCSPVETFVTRKFGAAGGVTGGLVDGVTGSVTGGFIVGSVGGITGGFVVGGLAVVDAGPTVTTDVVLSLALRELPEPPMFDAVVI